VSATNWVPLQPRVLRIIVTMFNTTFTIIFFASFHFSTHLSIEPCKIQIVGTSPLHMTFLKFIIFEGRANN
jgi:hypothetical protein